MLGVCLCQISWRSWSRSLVGQPVEVLLLGMGCMSDMNSRG